MKSGFFFRNVTVSTCFSIWCFIERVIQVHVNTLTSCVFFQWGAAVYILLQNHKCIHTYHTWHTHEHACMGTHTYIKSPLSSVRTDCSRGYVHHFAVAWPVIELELAVVILSVGLDLSASAPLFEHLIFARKHWEKPSQTDSQLDRKQSSKEVRCCLGWFMPCSGMLNEFRVHCFYGSWLNGHCLLSQWCMLFSEW